MSIGNHSQSHLFSHDFSSLFTSHSLSLTLTSCGLPVRSLNGGQSVNVGPLNWNVLPGPHSPKGTKFVQIPPVFRDLAEVLSKRRVCSLSPHRSYNMAIDLLPSAALPQGRLFPLSTSHASEGFFFVKKRIGASALSSNIEG